MTALSASATKISEEEMYQLGREYSKRVDQQRDEKERKAQQVRAKRNLWWNDNGHKAKPLMDSFNNCILENIGSAHTDLAVRQVRYSCKKVYWPSEWPADYISGPSENQGADY